jgi:hypothetical protein
MSGLNCAILMRALLRLSLLVRICTIGNAKLSLRNLVNLLMIALLDLSPLLVAYILMILLLILIMNVLNNYCILLIMFEI